MTLSDLAGAVRIANNDRLDGRITREQHATFIRVTQTQLDRNGWDWDALAAEMQASA